MVYQWYKDGVAIPQGLFRDPKKTFTELVIGGESQLGSGVYHCEATFSNGSKAISRSAAIATIEGVVSALTDTSADISIESEYSVDWTIDHETFIAGGSSLRIDSNSIFQIVAPSGGVISFWAKTEGLTDQNSLESSTRLTRYNDLYKSHDWKRYEFFLGSQYEDERNVFMWARFIGDTPATLWLDDLQFSTEPAFTRQPESIQTRLGESIAIRPALHSVSPLTYQWYKDGVAIPGATASILTIDSVSDESFGTYELDASNSSGTIRSQPAVLSSRIPINKAVDAPNLAIQTGGHASWSINTDEWLFNASSIVSPALDIGQVSYIEFQVTGPVKIGLYAKPIQGTERAFARVYIDGEPIDWIEAWYGRWTFFTYNIETEGITTIRFEASNSETIDPEKVESQRLLLDRIQLHYPAYYNYLDWIEEQTNSDVSSNAGSLAPLADANSNGIANLLDYLFVNNAPNGLNPSSFELSSDGQSSYYNVQATLRRDYEYAVQFESSFDLKNWIPSEHYPSNDSILGDPATQTFNWRVYSPAGKTFFFRWNAYGPEGGFSPLIESASTESNP